MHCSLRKENLVDPLSKCFVLFDMFFSDKQRQNFYYSASTADCTLNFCLNLSCCPANAYQLELKIGVYTVTCNSQNPVRLMHEKKTMKAVY